MKLDSVVTFKAASDEKRKFISACDRNKQNVSEVLRDLMNGYSSGKIIMISFKNYKTKDDANVS